VHSVESYNSFSSVGSDHRLATVRIHLVYVWVRLLKVTSDLLCCRLWGTIQIWNWFVWFATHTGIIEESVYLSLSQRSEAI